MRRSLPLLALAALLTAAAALSGCGHAEFASGAAPGMGGLVSDAGLVVLDQGSAENRYAGGTSAEWYEVGREGSEDAGAVVFVLRFESQRDRDAAYRQVTHRMARRLPPAVVYTAGDAVIQVGHIGDLGTARDLDDALQEAGAQ